jgi:hypothetical protein
MLEIVGWSSTDSNLLVFVWICVTNKLTPESLFVVNGVLLAEDIFDIWLEILLSILLNFLLSNFSNIQLLEHLHLLIQLLKYLHLLQTLLQLLVNAFSLLSQDLQLIIDLPSLNTVFKLFSEVLVLILKGLVVGFKVSDRDGGVHDGLVGGGFVLEHVVCDFEIVVFDFEVFVLLGEVFVCESQFSDEVGGSDHGGWLGVSSVVLPVSSKSRDV